MATILLQTNYSYLWFGETTAAAFTHDTSRGGGDMQGIAQV